MKKICFLLLAVCLIGVACKEDEPEKEQSLANTKWKLAGIMDMDTGILQELEPKDCEECYTLTFDTDSTATSLSIWAIYNINLLRLDLYRDLCCPDNDVTCGPWGGACLHAEAKDGIAYEDSYLFRRGIERTRSYEWVNNEFKFFFTTNLGGNYYLSFRPFK